MTDAELVQIAEQTAWKLTRGGQLPDETPSMMARAWEDLRQNVMVALLEARGDIEAADRSRAYAYRVAWNTALAWQGKWKAARTVPFSRFASIEALAQSAKKFWSSTARQRDHVEAILDRDTIEYALSHVSAEAGEALRLKYECEYTWAEVAARTGQTEAGAKKLAQRAIREIRKKSCPD